MSLPQHRSASADRPYSDALATLRREAERANAAGTIGHSVSTGQCQKGQIEHCDTENDTISLENGGGGYSVWLNNTYYTGCDSLGLGVLLLIALSGALLVNGEDNASNRNGMTTTANHRAPSRRIPPPFARHASPSPRLPAGPVPDSIPPLLDSPASRPRPRQQNNPHNQQPRLPRLGASLFDSLRDQYLANSERQQRLRHFRQTQILPKLLFKGND